MLRRHSLHGPVQLPTRLHSDTEWSNPADNEHPTLHCTQPPSLTERLSARVRTRFFAMRVRYFCGPWQPAFCVEHDLSNQPTRLDALPSATSTSALPFSTAMPLGRHGAHAAQLSWRGRSRILKLDAGLRLACARPLFGSSACTPTSRSGSPRIVST